MSSKIMRWQTDVAILCGHNEHFASAPPHWDPLIMSQSRFFFISLSCTLHAGIYKQKT